jgi:hypothetical protein
MKEDVLEEVRRVREELAAKDNFDIKAIVADAQKRQGSSGHRVVSFVKRKKK